MAHWCDAIINRYSQWEWRDNYFACSAGWANLISTLCADIEIELQKHDMPKDWRLYIAQVKEKFGGLRFYVLDAPKQVYELISVAERKSFTICEVCGLEGAERANDNGWIRTTCAEHKQIDSEELTPED